MRLVIIKVEPEVNQISCFESRRYRRLKKANNVSMPTLLIIWLNNQFQHFKLLRSQEPYKIYGSEQF